MDVLVSLEHADEEGDRAVGERRDGRLREGRELRVRREHAGRLDAHVADDAGREGRERAHGVRPPKGDERSAVGERGDERARGRAVEARPGPPVAVDLDDDRRVAPRKRSARERGECLVRALGEDRVGGPVAQLPRDPGRERAVEARSVERGDGGATLEGERPVAGRRPAGCGSEDAEREPLLERGELPLEGPFSGSR